MSGPQKLLALCLVAYATASLAKLRLVPDIVPIAWSEGPQPLWQVQTAFLLTAVENIALLVPVLLLLIAIIRRIERWLRPSRDA